VIECHLTPQQRQTKTIVIRSMTVDPKQRFFAIGAALSSLCYRCCAIFVMRSLLCYRCYAIFACLSFPPPAQLSPFSFCHRDCSKTQPEREICKSRGSYSPCMKLLSYTKIKVLCEFWLKHMLSGGFVHCTGLVFQSTSTDKRTWVH
jgi:hypothetical protein